MKGENELDPFSLGCRIAAMSVQVVKSYDNIGRHMASIGHQLLTNAPNASCLDHVLHSWRQNVTGFLLVSWHTCTTVHNTVA